MDDGQRPPGILLIEDNQGDVVLTRHVLQEIMAPVELTVAPSGERAMALLQAHEDLPGQPRPDLILLDLNLPGMSGHDVLAAVKSDPALRRIPIVALTSSSADADIESAYDHGVNAYITKPVDLPQFIDAMRSLHHFWFRTATYHRQQRPLAAPADREQEWA